MAGEKVTHNSWKTIVMPEARVRFEVDQTFSQEEYEYLQRGQIPQQMEDKWFVYFEGDWLFLHRSWTGYCIYQVRLASYGEKWKIAEVWANNDPDQFQPRTPERRKDLLVDLLGSLASGRSI